MDQPWRARAPPHPSIHFVSLPRSVSATNHIAVQEGGFYNNFCLLRLRVHALRLSLWVLRLFFCFIWLIFPWKVLTRQTYSQSDAKELPEALFAGIHGVGGATVEQQQLPPLLVVEGVKGLQCGRIIWGHDTGRILNLLQLLFHAD